MPPCKGQGTGDQAKEPEQLKPEDSGVSFNKKSMVNVSNMVNTAVSTVLESISETQQTQFHCSDDPRCQIIASWNMKGQCQDDDSEEKENWEQVEGCIRPSGWQIKICTFNYWSDRWIEVEKGREGIPTAGVRTLRRQVGMGTRAWRDVTCPISILPFFRRDRNFSWEHDFLE